MGPSPTSICTLSANRIRLCADEGGFNCAPYLFSQSGAEIEPLHLGQDRSFFGREGLRPRYYIRTFAAGPPSAGGRAFARRRRRRWQVLALLEAPADTAPRRGQVGRALLP